LRWDVDQKLVRADRNPDAGDNRERHDDEEHYHHQNMGGLHGRSLELGMPAAGPEVFTYMG
jgi:hypothetical protein